MKTKAPVKGLLLFTFHAASSNLAILYLLSVLIGIVFLVTETALFYIIFVVIIMLNIPLAILMKMGSNEGKWERFQLTMPIRRSNLLDSQYLGILFAAIVSALFLFALIGAGVISNMEMFSNGLGPALIESAYVFVMPLLKTGIILPLVSTKAGKNRESVVLTITMLVVMGVNTIVPHVSNLLGLSADVITILLASVSVIIFIVSYFITRKLYAKIVF